MRATVAASMRMRVLRLLAIAAAVWSSSCGDVKTNLISPIGGASPCGSSAQCSDGEPMCSSNTDCTGERNLCNTTSHRCVECLVDGHCHSKVETCSLVLGACAVKCTTVSDCPSTDRFCDGAIGYCVECQTDQDCAGSPQPLCRGSLCTQ